MNIRLAKKEDSLNLYEIGKNTPEFKVSATEVFMDVDEFLWAISGNKNSVFLIAEEGKQIAGFIYANAKDLDKPLKKKYATLVYIVVLPAFRKKGVAERLYRECEDRLKKMGITNIYAWASSEGDGSILRFMERQGFAKGHQYVWLDKEL